MNIEQFRNDLNLARRQLMAADGWSVHALEAIRQAEHAALVLEELTARIQAHRDDRPQHPDDASDADGRPVTIYPYMYREYDEAVFDWLQELECIIDERLPEAE